MPLIVLAVLLFSGNIVNMSTYLYVEYIEFVDDEMVLQKDSDDEVSATLKINIFPLLANNREVEFWSDDPNIVSVNQDGQIVGHDFGSTYIHAKSKENETKTDYIRIIVTSSKVRKLWLGETHKDMYVGDTYTLDVKYLPNDVIDTALNYASSNESVAIVDKSGKIEVRGGGSAKITVSLKSDPNLNATFNISAKPRVSSMSIADKTTVFSAKTQFLFPEIQLLPAGANEPIAYMLTDDSVEAVATVDSDGNITFTDAGTITVRAYIYGTDFYVEKTYTSTFGKFASISFLQDSPTDIKYTDYVGNTLALKYSFTPVDADPTRLEIASSNTNVISCENGVLTVLLGGKSTITISGEGVDGDTIVATSTININRTSDTIGFTGDKFNPDEGNEFIYFAYFEPDRGEDCVTLDARSLPKDANDKIHYALFDENDNQISNSSVAYIEGDGLYFGSATKEAKYLKVKVMAYTDSGVKCEVIVTYIDIAEKIDVGKSDLNTISRNMPTTGNGEYTFALVDYSSTDFNNIKFTIVSGDSVLRRSTATSPIFTLLDRGDARIRVDYLDDKGDVIRYKTLDINVGRLVEEITDIKVKTSWESAFETINIADDNNSYNVYSSASKFTLEYSMKPFNTTIDKANISIVSKSKENIATISDNVVIFNGHGFVKVEIMADNVVRYVTLTSTYGYPDENTMLKNIPSCGYLTVEKGDSIESLFDYISTSPKNIDKTHITFEISAEENAISLNGDKLNALSGNSLSNLSVVTANVDLGGGKQKSLDIKVYVVERATGTKASGQQYFYTNQDVFDLTGLFTVTSPTANTNLDITYICETGDAVVSGRTLRFNNCGRAVVRAEVALDNQSVGRISIVYTGNNLPVTDASVLAIKGETLVFKPIDELLSSATYDKVFEVETGSDIEIDDIFVLVNSSGTVTFGSYRYSITCLEQLNSQSLSLYPQDNDKYQISNGKYLTAESTMQMSWAYDGGLAKEYINNGYMRVSYSTNAKSVSSSGLITFDSASDYIVTLEIKYIDSVIGASDIGVRSNISSTMGVGFLSANKTYCELDFNEEDLPDNCIDIRDYIDISPKPLILSSNTVLLTVTEGNEVAGVSAIDPLKINYTRGGNFSVTITNKTDLNSTLTIAFKVKRSAYGVTLSNGDDIYSYYEGCSEDSVIVGSRATIYISPDCYPSDANVDTQITWAIKSGYEDIASVPASMDRVVFQEENKEIEVVFTVGSGSKAKTIVVRYKTTAVMFEVDLDTFSEEENVIVVTQQEAFTFISKDLNTSSIIITKSSGETITSTNDVFEIDESLKDTVTISDGNMSFRYIMVVASNMQAIDGVKISDVNNSGRVVSGINTKDLHITASKSMSISTLDLNGYGADGEKLKYTYKVNSEDIATISDSGVVSFKKAGTIRVSVMLTYKTLQTTDISTIAVDENAFKDVNLIYEFEIKSTFGKTTGFSMDCKDYTYLYDTMSDKTIDIISNNIFRTAPLYGVASDKVEIDVISGSSVAVQADSTLKVVSSGSTKVSVRFEDSNTQEVNIVINKEIDSISILESATNKDIYRVVTSGSSYSFKFQLKGDVVPTLLSGLQGVVDGASISSVSVDSLTLTGNITLSNLDVNNVYSVTLYDNISGVSNKLEVVVVESRVEILDLDNENVYGKGIVLRANKPYIFEDKYNKNIYEISSEDIGVTGVGVFEASCGSSGKISLVLGANTKNVNFVVVEEIAHATLTNVWSDGHVTAMGSRDDNKGINLKEYYKVEFSPSTAGTYAIDEHGKYVRQPYFVRYSLTGDGAYIESDILYFTTRNSRVTINIHLSDDYMYSKTLTSTLGYATNLSLSRDFATENYDNEFGGLVFNYGDDDISLDTGVQGNLFKLIAPVDAYKIDENLLRLDIIDTGIANVVNGKLEFVGGGETAMELDYNGSISKIKIYVINRATGISIKYNGVPTNYLITAKGKNERICIDYEIMKIDEATLSDYVVEYKSDNIGVASIDKNGNVDFVGAGRTTITVTVASRRNNAGIYDAMDSIIIQNNSNYEILNATKNATTSDRVQLSLESTKKYVVFPSGVDEYVGFDFSVSVGNDIVTVNDSGELELLGRGGYATIHVVAYKNGSDYDVLNCHMYVWKRASISLSENDVVTSKSSWQINPIIDSSDGSMVGKVVTYTSNDLSVANVTDSGMVTFAVAGSVDISVVVTINGRIETSQVFKIRSTFGVAERFELYQIINNSENNILDGDTIEIKTKDKNKLNFVVKNVYPFDCNIALNIMTDGKNNYDYDIDESNVSKFALRGIRHASNDSIGIGVSGSAIMTLKVKIIELAESVDITMGGEVVTNKTISTYKTTINLGYVFNNDVSNTVTDNSVLWKIVDGNDYASIDETADGCVLTIGVMDKIIKLGAISGDLECEAFAYFTMTDISGFGVDTSAYATINNSASKYNGYIYIGGDAINKDEVNIGVEVFGINDFDGWNFFTYTTQNGSNCEIDITTKQLTIELQPYMITPEFSEIVTIVYKNTSNLDGEIFTHTLKIYRDGISKLEFYYGGSLMDETLTQSAGLQQMLVFGNKSYYGGIQNYYNLNVKTTTLQNNSDTVLSGDGIVWVATNKNNSTINLNVTLSNNTATIPTGGLSVNTFDQMFNNDFETGKMTLYAYNLVGTVLYSYSFYFVDGVNVFSANDFVNCGSNAVLHCDLGHDDELNSGLISQDRYYNSYSPKSIVYGNGHLINLNARHDDNNALTKYGYVNYENPYIINTIIKGGNNGKSEYHTQFGNARKIAYSELYNMFRAVELNSGDVYIKNSLLRNFTHSVVNASNNCDTARNIYLENTIMFDVGKRAIEVQSKNDSVHITGIFDVYNFQNEDDLRDAINAAVFELAIASRIMSLAENNKLTTSIPTGKTSLFAKKEELWANFFCLATKDGGNGAMVLWYESGFGGNSSEDIADMGKVSMTYASTYSAWAFKNTHRITWYDEFDGENSSVAVKKTNMIAFMVKLKRLA